MTARVKVERDSELALIKYPVSKWFRFLLSRLRRISLLTVQNTDGRSSNVFCFYSAFDLRNERLPSRLSRRSLDPGQSERTTASFFSAVYDVVIRYIARKTVRNHAAEKLVYFRKHFTSDAFILSKKICVRVVESKRMLYIRQSESSNESAALLSFTGYHLELTLMNEFVDSCYLRIWSAIYKFFFCNLYNRCSF